MSWPGPGRGGGPWPGRRRRWTGRLRAAVTGSLLAHHLSPPRTEIPGTNLFLTLRDLGGGGGLALSFFCPETVDETLYLGGEEKLFEPQPMMISFVILEIYFFIILIADVLFIYLICIREPESRKLYRLGLLFVGWFGAFYA